MRLLVCLDFDGTLAELDPDPYAVRIHPDAEVAIRRLAAIPETEVAILTGRHIEVQLKTLATDGAYVEVKPYQRVLHVAKVQNPDTAQAILAAADTIDTHGRPKTHGHNVVEFSAVEITKGTWLNAYKQAFDRTIFAGDDDTDEHAMAVLDDTDLGIKVGTKPSRATRRVPDVDAMAQLLTQLADEREAWSATR